MLNKVILTGRLTKDPELRYTKSDEPKAFVNFCLAVSRDYKLADGSYPVDFIDIVAWRKRAEFVCQYFKKGRLMTVEGRLQRDNWTDKNGTKRSTYKIVATNCYFSDSKKDTNSTQDENNNDAPTFQDDDLPF